jgi:hypothetical protein
MKVLMEVLTAASALAAERAYASGGSVVRRTLPGM